MNILYVHTPSHDLLVDPCTHAAKRHHQYASGIQRAITGAVRAAGITKRATAHTLRAAFAHRLKEAGGQLDDTRSEKLMGHADTRSGTTQHDREGQEPAHKRLRGPCPGRPDRPAHPAPLLRHPLAPGRLRHGSTPLRDPRPPALDSAGYSTACASRRFGARAGGSCAACVRTVQCPQ
ncbi:MAG: tyrosine-type recombinase/integrase [Anaerolineae bacterium]